ncbi:hypothetical protein J1605_022283 [Eschrichtius robustus]|uniref:Uncharacterized protein n=1 Tax=Eschrichtius robustus TaxID=9764 RepID=A0AB34HB98_ESCRO|nr:hypothetical protein J1605_022283 [Eschrichtius robustus]
MPLLFLSHLLGVWLLLSQLPREISGQRTNDLIKACGRELVRLWVEICGSVSWGRTALSLEEPWLGSGPPAGESTQPPPRPAAPYFPLVAVRLPSNRKGGPHDSEAAGA